MYKRHIHPEILETLNDTPVILLVGARQVGKSTLAKTICSHQYTLDDLGVLSSAKADPVGFIESLPDCVLIDEIQRAPELLLPIKASIDRDRRPGRFFLTGSANVLTLPQVADSLARRIGIHHLLPLSQSEIDNKNTDFIASVFSSELPPFQKLTHLVERIVQGGYPEVINRSSKRRSAWYANYLHTLMTRDVRDLSRISNVIELPRLLHLLAARSGNLLNSSDLARDAKLNNVIFMRYMSLLESLFLVKTLPAWSGNITKRLIKAPKVLIPDTGLACHLLGYDQHQLLSDRKMLGNLLENFCIAEIEKQLGWSQVSANIYHYRTASGQEVDAVLENQQGKLVGIEIKSALTLTDKDFRGLKALQVEAGDRFHRGIVLYTGDKSLPYGENLYSLPISSLWS